MFFKHNTSTPVFDSLLTSIDRFEEDEGEVTSIKVTPSVYQELVSELRFLPHRSFMDIKNNQIMFDFHIPVNIGSKNMLNGTVVIGEN